MATLKSAIYEEHKRYKSDQKSFSIWVVKTCFSLGIVPTSTPRTRPQLPTRTYSDLKQVASKTYSEPTIEELEKMTDSIAAYMESRGKAPEGIRDALIILSALLSGRRECGALCRIENSTDSNGRSESDIIHEDIIASLMRIQKALQDALLATSSDQPPMSKWKSSSDEENHEVPDGSVSHPTENKPVSPEQRGDQSVKSAGTISASPLPDYASTVMRSLEALAPIRRSVRTTWSDYQAGKSDLYDATEITRYAFALALGIVEELNATSTKSELLFECFVRLGEGSRESAAKSDPNDLSYARASGLLALVREYIDLEHSKSDSVSVRREELKERCMDYHPLASLLCVLADHLPKRAKGKCKGLALYEQTDPLLLSLLGICDTRKVTLEATVVVQVYLELYEAAGMPNHRHLDTLKAAAKIMKRSLSTFNSAAKKFEKKPLSPELTSEASQACRFIADEVIGLGETEPKLARGDASPKSILHFLLIHFPLLCGTVYVSMNNNFYIDGIQVSRHESRVTAALHLYRATSCVGRSQTWTQLEELLELQGKEALGLVGADDKDFDPFEAAIEMSIALGIPRTDFEESALKNEAGLIGRLPLPYMVNVSGLALPMNKHSLLNVEQGTAIKSDRPRTTSPVQSRRFLQLLSDQMAAAHPDIASSMGRQERFRPEQLLKTFSKSLAADTPHLRFNHHELTLACWELHRTITKDHHHELRANRIFFFGETGASGKSNVIDDVLWEAVAWAHQAQEDPSHPGTNCSMLQHVVPVLDKLIKRQDSK
jgi:hypothetical protein